MKLQVIVGSTRPARAADRVVRWVTGQALHEAFDTEVIDLRDWPLPMFGEHAGSIGDPDGPSYSDPAVRQWNRKIAEADAYLVVTPEWAAALRTARAAGELLPRKIRACMAPTVGSAVAAR